MEWMVPQLTTWGGGGILELPISCTSGKNIWCVGGGFGGVLYHIKIPKKRMGILMDSIIGIHSFLQF